MAERASQVQRADPRALVFGSEEVERTVSDAFSSVPGTMLRLVDQCRPLTERTINQSPNAEQFRGTDSAEGVFDRFLEEVYGDTTTGAG